MIFFEKGKKAAIFLIVIGAMVFLMGLVGLGWFAFEETDYVIYGGDAYTGIQNAAADTANNVAKACGILVSVMGYITLSVGGLFLNYFEMKKFEYNESNKKHLELLAVLDGVDITNIKSTSVGEAKLDKKNEEQTDCQQYVCSICKSPIAHGATKCDNCGASVDWNLL